MPVRAKFRCNLNRGVWADHNPPVENPTTKVQLTPVGPSYDAAGKLIPNENSQFWDSSPSGELTLYIKNGEAAQQFVEGKDYYLDFTPAN